MNTLDYVLIIIGFFSLLLSICFAASVTHPSRSISSHALELYRCVAYNHGYQSGMDDAFNNRPARNNPQPPEGTNFLV